MKDTLLPKLVLHSTRLVVGTYTALTLPVYMLKQRPWQTIRQRKLKRTSLQLSNNGSYHFWKRYGPPVAHPANYHQCNSIKEVLQVMRQYERNDLDKPRLGYREVFSEKMKYDDKGQPVKQDGKVLKEIQLSDKYQWLTIKQVFELVDKLSRGFASVGITPREKVIIYADTRIEWFLTALSLFELDSIIVTLFSNLGKNGLIHGIKQTEAKYLITSIDLLPRIHELLEQTNNIEKIIYMHYDFQKEHVIPKFPERIQLIPFDQIKEMGKSAPKLDVPLPALNSVSLIMYTSGTTGIPKAVIIENQQVRAAIRALTSNVVDLAEDGPRHVYASFLPLAHIMGLTFELFLFTGGVRIGYSSPHTLTDNSPAHVLDQVGDLKLLQPTVLITVPLILDRIIKEIYLRLTSRSPILPPLFTYLMDYKIKWIKRGFDTPLINRLVCKRVREQFGGNLEFVVSGGAPLNSRTEELIRAALDVKLMQGYGSTETTGGVVGMPREDFDSGKAGYPLDGVKIRLESWPEGNYTLEDKPNPRGEILVGGEGVSSGYYKLPEETKHAFTVCSEGTRWFYTGDIGEIYPNGAIRIIDRKKDLAKLPNGEYISLGKIESVIKTTPLVENVCVCVSEKSNNIGALVTLNDKQLRMLATQLNKHHLSREQLCTDSQVQQTVINEIITVCHKSQLHRREIPAKIHLCAEEWLPDNELLTAAFKLKRQNVLNFYRKQIEQMFSVNSH